MSEPVERSIAFAGTGNPQTTMESAMQPAEIVQNAIGACEHIFKAKSLVDMDALFVNAPAILGDISHIQPAVRETYCLWQHVCRVLEAIAMHQSCAKSLISISLDEINAVDGLLYDNMQFPNGIYNSELKSCFHAINQLTPMLSCRPGREIEFIQEEWIASGFYESDVTELIQSTFTGCITLANMQAAKLAEISLGRLQKELRVLVRLQEDKGVALFDVGMYLEDGDSDCAIDWVNQIGKKRGRSAPEAIGKCPFEARRPLYKIPDILDYVEEKHPLEPREKTNLFAYLSRKARHPK